MPRDNGANAWDRQPRESAQAYEAFSRYRDLGADRSLQAVADGLSKSVQLIKRWSSAWEWVDRVREYDDKLQKEANEKAYKEAVKAVKDMQVRHIKTAVLMQKTAVEALSELDKRDLRPIEIIRLIAEGARIEQEARNAATRNEDIVDDPLMELIRKWDDAAGER